EAQTPRRGWRRATTALALCVALLAIFHRPILLAIGRQIALRYAAREHLKADFRLEGNPFSNLTVRNLRGFAVGPSGIESIDIDLTPRKPGDVRIENLQLPAGDSWRKISGQTSYTNKNLIVRDVLLSDQEQIHLLNVDASQSTPRLSGSISIAPSAEANCQRR